MLFRSLPTTLRKDGAEFVGGRRAHQGTKNYYSAGPGGPTDARVRGLLPRQYRYDSTPAGKMTHSYSTESNYGQRDNTVFRLPVRLCGSCGIAGNGASREGPAAGSGSTRRHYPRGTEMTRSNRPNRAFLNHARNEHVHDDGSFSFLPGTPGSCWSPNGSAPAVCEDASRPAPLPVDSRRDAVGPILANILNRRRPPRKPRSPSGPTTAPE